MKYSEYLQLRDILEEEGISEEEYNKNPQLYEGILGAVGKGLLNLAKKGMKAAVSKGISEQKKSELNSSAEKIKTWIINEVIKAKDEENHPIHNLLSKKENYKSLLTKSATKTAGEKAAINKIKIIDRELSKFLRKKVDNKAKKIEQKISRNKNINENDKAALLEYWEDLSINLQIAITESLADADIIEDTSVEDVFSVLAKEQSFRQGRNASSTPK